MNKILLPALMCIVLLSGCDYIVLPEELATPTSTAAQGWSAVATEVKAEGGALRIALTLRNDTGTWSAMKAIPDKPAVLAGSDGKTTNCETVFVSTGGHRLAPGFQIRGYTAGTKQQPATQLVYVECAGVEATAAAAPGGKLTIDYTYVTGEYNYYYQEAGKVNAEMVVDLDQVAAGLQYPVATPVDGVIQAADTSITAINNCVLTLLDATRTDKGMELTWETTNPGEYPSYVHIGIPPVVGSDGIIYGLYESPDIASPPITSPGKTADWTTQVAVPTSANGLYILLSVESKQQRMFWNYALDITGK